jgi:hypothetical protein
VEEIAMTQDQIEEFVERAAIIEEGCQLDKEKAERLAAIYMGLDYDDVAEFLQGTKNAES